MRFAMTEDYRVNDEVLLSKDLYITIVPLRCFNDIDYLCLEEGIDYSEAKFFVEEFFEVIYSSAQNVYEDNVTSYVDRVQFDMLPDYLKEHKIEVVE